MNLLKILFKRLKTLRLYFIRRSEIVVKDEELSSFLVKIQHKIPRTGSLVFKYNGKYYRIKELG